MARAARMRGDSTTCSGTCGSSAWIVCRATTAAGCCAATAPAMRRAARSRTGTATERPTAAAKTGSGCSAAPDRTEFPAAGTGRIARGYRGAKSVDRPWRAVHECSRIARIPSVFVKFVLIRRQQVVGGFSWRGRGARGKGEAESFPLREGSGGRLLVEAVRKPLLLLAGGDGTDATNGTTTKHPNAQTQNSPQTSGKHLGTDPGGVSTNLHEFARIPIDS